MVKILRSSLFVLFLVSSFIPDLIAQSFDVEAAKSNFESLVATTQDLPAAKQGIRIGDYYFSEEEYTEAIKYYTEAGAHAEKTSNVLLHANTLYKKGLSQKKLAESGSLSMADEQLYFKNCIESFKKASEFYVEIKKTGSREHIYSLFYGGEALYIIGNYEAAVTPLRTALRYAQKNRIEPLILKSSDLLAKTYDHMDNTRDQEYYQSIYDSYYELKVSKDSLKFAYAQLRLSKDSLAKSHQKLMSSIDSLERTQNFLKKTSESLSKSKDSLMRSRESLRIYEDSLQFAQDSLMMSVESLQQSYEDIAKLDSANLGQRSELEIRQAEIIKHQQDIINKQKEIDAKKKEIDEKEKEVNNRQKEVNRLSLALSSITEQLYYSIGAIAFAIVLLLLALLAYQYKRRTTKKLEENNRQISNQKSQLEKQQHELKKEKSKTDQLLLNILPAPVADELKKHEKVTPKYYKKVTIMFTDFKGFTTIASQMSPGEIVKELDGCFKAFDQIIENYEQHVGRKCVEKIKTIGDGYMCAGGIPIENDTSPLDIVRVGLAFAEYMQKRKKEKIARNEPCFEIRIGINTGTVVAGVVGQKKFAYDIWGDAVNLASRLESSGEVGRVNISEETYRYIKDQFFFTPRGKINAKNKGEVEMYFVDGRVKYSKAENA